VFFQIFLWSSWACGRRRRHLTLCNARAESALGHGIGVGQLICILKLQQASENSLCRRIALNLSVALLNMPLFVLKRAFYDVDEDRESVGKDL
jgi:hypothetical protein